MFLDLLASFIEVFFQVLAFTLLIGACKFLIPFIKRQFDKNKKALVCGVLAVLLFVFVFINVFISSYGSVYNSFKSEIYSQVKIFANEEITKIYNESQIKEVSEYKSCTQKYSKSLMNGYYCGDKPSIKLIEPNQYILSQGSLSSLNLLEDDYDWKNERFINKGKILHKLSENDEYLSVINCWTLLLKKSFIPFSSILLLSIAFYFMCFYLPIMIRKLPKDNLYLFSYICILSLLLCTFFPENIEDNGLEGVYTLTKLLTATLAGLITYKSYKINSQSKWIISFGLILVLFNPVINVHFERELWQILDFIAVLIIIFYLWKTKKVMIETNHRDSKEY